MITIVFGRAAQFLLALAMMRVATTLLSPEEMGRVSLVLTTVAFYAMFLVNPVGMFINRRLHAWDADGKAKSYLIRYGIYLLLVALIAALTLPIFSWLKLVDFGVSLGWLVLLVCGSLLFNTVNQTSIPSLNLLGDSRHFVVLSLATLAASFVCGAALVKTIQPTSEYWLLGLLIGQAVLAVVGIRALLGRLNTSKGDLAFRVERPHLQTLFAFAWPVAIAAGLAWVQGQGYRYIVQGLLGLAPLGLFVAGYAISAGMISGFESVLTTYFQPKLYRDVNLNHHADVQARAWQRYASAVIPSLILTAALIIILAAELTRLFLGASFQGAADYVVWGALAEAARVLMGIYSLIAHVHMRTSWLIWPSVLGAGLSLGLCALLIPRMGATGAGIGLVVSGYAVVATLHLILARRVGGGSAVRPMLMAVLASLLLWLLALGLRSLVGEGTLGMTLAVLGFVGAAYLGLQYLFLRAHLTGENSA